MWAVTVQQPWAWAIVDGHKDVENRTGLALWQRVAGERVAVHSSKRWSIRGASSPLVLDAFDRAHDIDPAIVRERSLPSGLFAPGVVLGTVEVLDVHPDAGCCRPWGESSYAETDGRVRTVVVHLRLADPQRLYDPIPIGGRLGPWRLPDDVADQVLNGAHT